MTLLVHNSFAYSLYDDVDGEPSVPTTVSPTTNPGCKKDVLILWDCSYSIQLHDVKGSIIPFLKGLVASKKLNVGAEGTHLGFITFSNRSNTKTHMKIGAMQDPKKLTDWLNLYTDDDFLRSNYSKVQAGGWTMTGKAFELANEEFSRKSPSNYRKDAADVILLFTDGQPNGRYNEKELADKFSKKLKEEKKVKIIGLAVGKKQTRAKYFDWIKSWSSKPSEEYFFKSKIENVKEMVDTLAGPLCSLPACQCKGRTQVTAFLGPDARTTSVTWRPSKAVDTSNEDCKLVQSPNVNHKRFSEGSHVLDYIFSSKGSTKTNCPVTVNVKRCSCPNAKTIEKNVEPGKSKVNVTWKEPTPNCPTTSSQSNPETRKSFSPGEYDLTYNYIYNRWGGDSFELECRVHIVITGERCGEVVYDPAEQDCCCGIVKDKNADYLCCGVLHYNVRTNTCCNKEKAILVPTGGKCP